MTKFVKKEEINSKWYEIDAKNAVVGRLATIITKILRGKNTAKYTCIFSSIFASQYFCNYRSQSTNNRIFSINFVPLRIDFLFFNKLCHIEPD